ncbi:unnamed protein product, partial [Rotaria sp. Silwood1]
MKAITDSTGRTVEQLKSDYKPKGDLGLVAESQQRKSDIIKSLLVSCQSHESRYLVRSLIGKLRIG